MPNATLKDLQVNPKKRLTSDMKKALVNIVEDEFQNQTTLMSVNEEEQKEEALERYRRKVGFKKLATKITRKELELKEAQEELYRKGLNNCGEIYSNFYGDTSPEIKEAVDKLKQTLEKISRAFTKPRNYKNKIVARLWMVDTVGEAMVILREVMGNEALPPVDRKLLTYEASE